MLKARCARPQLPKSSPEIKSGEWAVFFRVMLSDDVLQDKLGDVATRVMWRTTDRLDLPNLGLFPYFDFRRESEQASRREPAWEPLLS